MDMLYILFENIVAMKIPPLLQIYTSELASFGIENTLAITS